MAFLCPLKVYKEQLKRESVLTAKAIINNDSIKIRYEKYIKVAVNNAHKYYIYTQGGDSLTCRGDL